MKSLKARDILFVSLQLLLFILYFLVPFETEWHQQFWIKFSALIASILGLMISVVALVQLRKNLSPFPSPVPKGTLVQSGLYKKIRHPIYTGLLLFFFGYAVWEASFFKLFVSFLLLGLFYLKSRYEEKLLSERFPDYKEYQRKSHRFFPFL